jgi:hypothetical protein
MTTISQSVQPGNAQSAAERMRAYRRRRRHGLRCVKVRVGRADLDGLVRCCQILERFFIFSSFSISPRYLTITSESSGLFYHSNAPY